MDNKIRDFDRAMKKYHRYAFYHRSGLYVSICIILLQALLFIKLIFSFSSSSPNALIGDLLTLIASYLTADFISGIVHLYMDNNTRYDSLAGPFIASFHLHHKHPVYKKRHPIKVYFFESGTKWWLLIYLMMILLFKINLFLVAFGIFSSLAEVSHYWCHNATQKNYIIKFLQKYYILLPMKHHRHHHISDNKHYAFLNGVTDFMINFIAKFLYKGYKNNSDVHALAYAGQQTDNR